MTTLLVLLLLMMTVNTYGQTNSSDFEGDNYIVGGQNARITDFPFMVVLRTTKADKRVYICGGTYIHELWVLTAAHCLTINADYPAQAAKHNAVRMRMGLGRSGQRRYQSSSSVKLIIHPQFRKSETPFLNDIALIKLKSKFRITKCVKIAKLRSRGVPVGGTVTAIGWGGTKPTDNPPAAKKLQRVDLTVWDERECDKVATKRGTICVGRKGQVPCVGDSGSPLVYKNSVVGVASYMYGCSGRVFVYTAVYKHALWINETIVMEDNRQLSSVCNLHVTHLIYFVNLLLTVI